MKKNTILALVCAVVFSLGSLQAQQKKNTSELKEIAHQKTEKISKVLNLSDSQKKQLQSVYYSKEVNMNTLDLSKDNSGNIAKFESGFNTRIKAILTPEQMKRFIKINANSKYY